MGEGRLDGCDVGELVAAMKADSMAAMLVSWMAWVKVDSMVAMWVSYMAVMKVNRWLRCW